MAFLLAETAGSRPVVVLAENSGTEITDFLVPYGRISEANVADVVAVSTARGPVSLMMGPNILADETMTSFDAAHPDGADYVVIPYIHEGENAATLGWLRAQSAKGPMRPATCSPMSSGATGPAWRISSPCNSNIPWAHGPSRPPNIDADQGGAAPIAG